MAQEQAGARSGKASRATRTFSYYRLWQEVNKFANVLQEHGRKKGDRVTIYMGRVPELLIAMLACAKDRRDAQRGLRRLLASRRWQTASRTRRAGC